MIKFVCGRTGSGKSEYIMDALKNTHGDMGDCLLIVPEQQAVAWESRTAKELSADALMSLEVLTFTRLCDRVCREYGGFFRNCATRASKQLLMWAAIESVRSSFSHYGAARAEKLVPSMIKTVKELCTYRVSPSEIQSVAEELESGEHTEVLLSKKLSDISLIYAAYEELLRNSFDDSEELPDRTAETVLEKGFFKGKRVFADSFYSVTPAQRDTLRAAMRDADEVVITFACPANDTDEPQFVHIRRYFEIMCAMAKEYGGYEIVSLDEQKRFRTPSLALLEREMWKFKTVSSNASSDGVTLLSVKDRYAEGDAAAAKICELVQSGARYSDIAVIARNIESLEGITDAAMQARGIPHYTSRRKALEGSAAAKLILAVLRVQAYGWRREDILTIIKTGLLPIEAADCDRFEKYIKMWRIRGRRAFCEDDWGMNPFGYRKASAELSSCILDSVNGARRKLCDPLSEFCEIFDGGSTRADKCAVALYKLLCALDVPSAISELAGNLREFGYTTESAETLRLWDALMSVLDTLATTIPDAVGDAESFHAMLRQIIAATDVGTIPTGIDEVALGSA
ncbi:MAG: hypothetical protein E7583_11150, partial [Ruminococcaceae bacterium]|nr:hypothetical protein [Oscillospiraceae bacterium]